MNAESRLTADGSSTEEVSPQVRRGEDAAENLAAILSDALEHFRTGVVLLATEGRILHSNSRGRKLIAGAEGVTCRGTALSIDRASPAAALAEMIDRAIHVQHRWHRHCVGLLALPTERSKCPLHVCVTAIAGPGDSRTAGLFISSAEGEREVGQSLLRTLFNLTPTESRVTQILVRGRSVAEAAAELGITVHTLRSHLKRIFEKTATRRQSELVRVVATGLNMLDLEF